MSKALRHLDLFSGAGGFALGARWVGGFQTTQFVEIDPGCQAVLKARFPAVPIHADIQTFQGRTNQWDCITAGFPCQGLSIANKHAKGLDDDRSGLWFEALRLLRECRPNYFILENVPSTPRRNWLRIVLEGINASGYDAQWSVVSVRSLGGRHIRKRHLLLAHPSSFRFNASETVTADINKNLLELVTRRWQSVGEHCVHVRGRIARIPLSPALRSVDGIPSQLDKARVSMMGNAVSPQAAMIPLLKALQLEQLRIKD